jgi:hypothetical protein
MCGQRMRNSKLKYLAMRMILIGARVRHNKAKWILLGFAKCTELKQCDGALRTAIMHL